MWIFGYGSLMWDPGFAPVEQVIARLDGWERSFCMTSLHYRGTVAAPGLVLALDVMPRAACTGLALRVEEAQADTVLTCLRARELVSSAYEERKVPVTLADGRKVRALAYVIDRGHAQYCHHAPEAQARIIARASGLRGHNRDYLFATAAHLSALGIADPALDALVQRVRALTAV